MKKNLTLKILAVLVSIFIWIQAMLLKHQSTEVNLPVKLTNVPENMDFSKPLQQSIRFHVEGRGIDILLLKLTHTYVEIDAEELKSSEKSTLINKYQVNLPKYITLYEIRPVIDYKVNVQGRDLEKKTVPVILQFASNEVESKFLQMNMEQSIDFAEIIGPKAIIDDTREVKTEPMSLSQLNGSAFSLDLIKPAKSVKITQNNIKLQPVQTELSQRTIAMVPVVSNDHKVILVPSWVSVKLRGKKTDIEQVTASDIKASVNTDNIKNNQFAPVRVTTDKPIRIIEFTPQRVRIQKNE